MWAITSFVAQQVVVDVGDVCEGLVLALGRHQYVGMTAVVAVDLADVGEVADPLLHTCQIEVGGTEGVDGPLIG